MVPHVLKKVQVKLAAVFEVPRKSMKSATLFVLLVVGLFLFIVLLTSFWQQLEKRKKKDYILYDSTQFYLVFYLWSNKYNFSPTL